jgi:signal transduction histidine kinase
MIEMPFISLDLLTGMAENFTIIATLVLLYHFIPDTLITRSKLVYPVCVGIIFGLAAAISIPSLLSESGAPSIGVNLVLVPLSGFIAGPVSTVFVATVLLIGSYSSTGILSLPDVFTVMLGVLLGSLFYFGRSWSRFPKSPLIQLSLLGIGVVIIEICGISFTAMIQGPSSLPPGAGSPPLISTLPFYIFSWAVAVIIGFLIGFIDRKKQAEKELLEYKDHLEGLVKERTAELRHANSLQKATIESTADGVVVSDRNNMIRAYNRKAARILNLPDHPPLDPQEAWVYADHIAASLLDPDKFIPLLASLPDSAEQIVTTDLKFTSGRIYELYVHPQRVGDQIVGRVWSLHDITERRLAEDAIAAANNKLMLLSTLTRHDIFNQLTAVAVYLELVQMEKHDPAVSGHLETMKKSLEVIRLQLEFTRDYEDLGLKKPEWQDVEEAFFKAADSFKGRMVLIRCDTGPVEIFADPMIGRVFYNLIDNSLRHGEKISQIRLSLETEDPDMIMVYEDNGVGVPPEDKERIFLKGVGKHTGLGMFLIKEILSITGIIIQETGTYHQGVRFEIRVPSGKFRLTS